MSSTHIQYSLPSVAKRALPKQHDRESRMQRVARAACPFCHMRFGAGEDGHEHKGSVYANPDRATPLMTN
jgi:cytochrome c